jgi:hypothetical protein
VGARFEDRCGGRLVDCAVNGTQGAAVLHNGRVDLASLRTSLPVVEQPEEPAGPPQTIINHFEGPVFNAEVHGAQFAWNNDNVVQRQTNEEGSGT